MNILQNERTERGFSFELQTILFDILIIHAKCIFCQFGVMLSWNIMLIINNLLNFCHMLSKGQAIRDTLTLNKHTLSTST